MSSFLKAVIRGIKKKKDAPYYFRERLRMKEKMQTEEGRMIQSKKKFAELSYNVQLGVSKNQIIVSNYVCQDKPDAHQFISQIKYLFVQIIFLALYFKNEYRYSWHFIPLYF